MGKTQRFNMRCDSDFLAEIDDWRRKQHPIPSRSEAIRILTLRSSALDRYLAPILKSSMNDLISVGAVNADADLEIYKRFQNVVLKAADLAASLDQERRQKNKEPDLSDDDSSAGKTLEKLFEDKFATKSQRYSK